MVVEVLVFNANALFLKVEEKFSLQKHRTFLEKKLLKDGVTETEVSDAKRRLAASAIFARDSLDGPARILGGAVANGQRVEDVEDWPARIAAVDKAAIDAAARKLFDINWSVTGILRPAPKEEVPS